MRSLELEDRTIKFGVEVIGVTQGMANDYVSKYLASQLTRSSLSVALNYGEAQDAESKNDFVHKIKVVLKELRESMVNLKIIQKAELCNNQEQLEKSLKEVNELISIFVISLKTARKKRE